MARQVTDRNIRNTPEHPEMFRCAASPNIDRNTGTSGTHPFRGCSDVPAVARCLVLGVDIGAQGGIALVTSAGDLMAVEPMPVLNDGPKGRPTVNAVLLAALLQRWSPASAYVELVGPRPGEAAGGAFSFGRARGVVEGVLAAKGIPARMIAPAVWKRAVSIPAGREGAKDLARAEACRRWPSMAASFAAKGSDGLAEAGLIAVAGLMRDGARRDAA